MPNQIYSVGLGNVGSYQVAGTPFVTGSTLLSASYSTNNAEHKIQFPAVAKSLTVINRSTTDIRVHFTSAGDGNTIANHHYITLEDSKDSVTFNVKCKEVYVSLTSSGSNGSYEVFAELTGIASGSMFTLTGSGLNS